MNIGVWYVYLAPISCWVWRSNRLWGTLSFSINFYVFRIPVVRNSIYRWFITITFFRSSHRNQVTTQTPCRADLPYEVIHHFIMLRDSYWIFGLVLISAYEASNSTCQIKFSEVILVISSAEVLYDKST